jgi:hypothetical protein
MMFPMNIAGIHEGGRRAFLRADEHQRKAKFHLEAAKLRLRMARLCHPEGILGELRMLRFRYRMTERLRQRFLLQQALF